jgi:PIN domain nuclease of toxin-antitoxin system
MVIKQSLGKLELQRALPEIVREQAANGLQLLPIELSHVLAVSDLPALHGDPFDRLLIAQATVEGAAILSADPLVARNHVEVVW